MSGKEFWGPSVWKTIHSFAIAYTPDQKQQFKNYINSLQYILPCQACREHLKQNLKILKIDDYLSNNHQLFLWSYLLHDRVNRQLGKSSPPFEQIKIIYMNGMGPDCQSCKIN